MDNLTHSLTGLLLARTGLKRFSPHGTVLLMISANIPDADIVSASRGALAYLEAHRGYSHSALCLPVVALIPVLIVAAIFRQRLPWRNAWILSCIGVASHLILDWTNSYGVRLLLPLSSAWYYLDLNALYDFVILAVLLFAVVWPLFSRLVSGEIGQRSSSGRTIAIAALVFFVLFDCGRAAMHRRATAQLEARLYDGAPALRSAAFPDSFNPFRWRGVVETAREYELSDVNALEGAGLEEPATYYKAAITPAYLSAKATEAFRFFSYFARFPVWSEEATEAGGRPGIRVGLSDLRFGTPEGGSFHCVSVENERHQVVRSGFTFGPASELP